MDWMLCSFTYAQFLRERNHLLNISDAGHYKTKMFDAAEVQIVSRVAGGQWRVCQVKIPRFQ